jgi:hypothetical protein
MFSLQELKLKRYTVIELTIQIQTDNTQTCVDDWTCLTHAHQ